MKIDLRNNKTLKGGKVLLLTILTALYFIFQGCKHMRTQPIDLILMPNLEYISNKSTGRDSTQNVKISLEAFYISNEITNKEYREFTDWARDNPDQTLPNIKEIPVKRMESGKTLVFNWSFFTKMSDLLPSLIDSSALFKLDKKYKNYFTDSKFDDYPVVGVSKNAAEYFCLWKTNFETVKEKVGRGKSKMILSIGPESVFRLPIELEWEYAAKQPIKRRPLNSHVIRKVYDGNTNKFGLSHFPDNVSEWVIVPDDTSGIAKGGSWKTSSYLLDRLRLHPDSSTGFIGFRIVRTYTPIKINKKQNK